jgi:membrane-associated phospholipid phosphatase
VAAALVLLLTATGLALTRGSGGLERWDDSVPRWAARHRTPLLTEAAKAATWLADTWPVAVLSVLAVGAAAALTRRWRFPLFLALVISGEKLLYLLISAAVDRPRPAVPPIARTHADTGWPSGHVGSAVALYAGVAVLLSAPALSAAVPAPARRLALLLAVLVPPVTASCRVYGGFHTPLDVLAGALLGGVWLAAVARVLLTARPAGRRRRRRGRARPAAPAAPPRRSG